MFAPTLMDVLAGLACKGQIPHAQYLDMAQRFASLRSYGLLPRGRERRAQPLTPEEIANAIFGLAAHAPQWAGHVALILSGLQLAGGEQAFFDGVRTLRDAVVQLLSSASLSSAFRRLELSCSEYWTNASGLAVLECEFAESHCTFYFVPPTCLSLLEGKNGSPFLDRERPPLDRRIVLSGRFFDELGRKISTSARVIPPNPDEGWEYDEEDLESARLARLGVKRGAHFLNVGVDNQVTWPKEATSVKFDRYELILLPKTKGNVQSVHIDLTSNRLGLTDAKSVIARFLSVLSWCSDNYAVTQDGWSGTPIPVPVPRRNLAFTTTSHWAFDRDIPKTEEIRRALALYREARNAHHNFLVGYAVVSYCKVIEIGNPESSDVIRWIKDNFALAQADPQFARVTKAFDAIRETTAPENYLWTSCRVAVAHGSPRKGEKSDPDRSEEADRLSISADVFQILARIFISKDLGVSHSPYSGD